MPVWEYKVEFVHEISGQRMDALGKEGWELAGVARAPMDRYTMVFKRKAVSGAAEVIGRCDSSNHKLPHPAYLSAPVSPKRRGRPPGTKNRSKNNLTPA